MQIACATLLCTLLIACGPAVTRCVSGNTVGCSCTDGRTGAQLCAADGTLGACECASAGDGMLPGPDLSFLETDMSTTPFSGKHAFVSSLMYTGDFGGLAGADSQCTLLAQGANLPGAYQAWLSTSAVNAIDHITGTGPWAATVPSASGAPIYYINNHAGLATYPLTPIVYDERGHSVAGTVYAWTGTIVGGTRAAAINLCTDWTAAISTVRGHIGEMAASDSTWTDFVDAGCQVMLHLYCFEK